MTETLEERIKRHEGYCPVPKPDTKGFYVIGYGHDITEAEAQQFTDPISIDTADDWLEADIDYARGEVHDKLPWSMQSPRSIFDVLTEMTFQMGIEGVLEFHHMLSALEINDVDEAAKAMLDSEWHKETPERCEELAHLVLSAYSQDSTTA